MFNIDVDDKVKFKVKGFMNAADGAAKPFSFWLTCKRLDTDAFTSAIDTSQGDVKYVDFMASVVEGWGDVRDANGVQVDYSEAALRRVCNNVPGLANVMFRTYALEVGVKEKN